MRYHLQSHNNYILGSWTICVCNYPDWTLLDNTLLYVIWWLHQEAGQCIWVLPLMGGSLMGYHFQLHNNTCIIDKIQHIWHIYITIQQEAQLVVLVTMYDKRHLDETPLSATQWLYNGKTDNFSRYLSIIWWFWIPIYVDNFNTSELLHIQNCDSTKQVMWHFYTTVWILEMQCWCHMLLMLPL